MRNFSFTTWIAVAALFTCALPARAALLWTQPPDGQGRKGVSEIFPDLTTFSVKLFDDVKVTGGDWKISKVTIYGVETGNMALNQGVFLRFTDKPAFNQSGQTFTGTEDASGNLTFNLTDYDLPPGTYWMSAWILRNFSGGGEWFWDRREPVTMDEAWFENPGGAWGHGTIPQEAHNFFNDASLDLAFDIEGQVVPEPMSAMILGIAGACVLRRARARV